MADSVITKQELIDAQKDAQALEEVINGEPGKLIKTRLGRLVYTLASVPQINTMTREEVTSALAPKADKAETAAALDTKANQSDTFLKTEVADLVAPKADKTYVDTALVGFTNGAAKFYPTLAAANADIANIGIKDKVEVGEVVNGGTWHKATAGATGLTKSPYDSFTQAKTEMNANANFKPVKIGDVSLDTLTQVGIYFATEVAYATTANKYPENVIGGIIKVSESDQSTLIVQEFFDISGVERWRRYNGTDWSNWYLKFDTSNLASKNSTFVARGVLDVENLDDVKVIGAYLQNTASKATAVNNYPVQTIGALEVVKVTDSSIVIQKYTTNTGKMFIRTFVTSWTSWVEHGGLAIQQSNIAKIVATITNATNANDLRLEFGYYIINNNNLDLSLTNLPIKAFGVLKVYRGTVSGFIVQEFVSSSGIAYIRHYNSSAWSLWSQIGQGGSASSDKIVFSKTATTLYFNLQNSGSGENVIKHRFIRQTDPERNLDNWGMSTCSVMTKADTTVSNLTTNGVWEVAIVDSQNISDHSGGGHGDEVKFLSYFLVDGVKYDEDFTGILSAKEVKHVQHSVIYVEAQNIPICTRKTTWTFNKNGCTSKTKLDWAEGRNINKARIAMLPIYRKSNDDGTGNQITDTEIRSQDDQIINVAEHGFALRDLPITDGDSILLSSAVSNISAEVKVKKIVAQDPHAYVQNTILYNKVYVNGFKETAAPFVTGANDVWEIETDFVIKVRG